MKFMSTYIAIGLLSGIAGYLYGTPLPGILVAISFLVGYFHGKD